MSSFAARHVSRCSVSSSSFSSPFASSFHSVPPATRARRTCVAALAPARAPSAARVAGARAEPRVFDPKSAAMSVLQARGSRANARVAAARAGVATAVTMVRVCASAGDVPPEVPRSASRPRAEVATAVPPEASHARTRQRTRPRTRERESDSDKNR